MTDAIRRIAVCVVSLLLLLGSTAWAQPARDKQLIPAAASAGVRKEIERLYSASPTERAYAAMALAKLGRGAEAAAPFLRSMLADDVLLRWQFSTGMTGSPTTPGREAAIALAHVSPRATDELLEVLSTAKPSEIHQLPRWRAEQRSAIAGLGSVEDSRGLDRLVQLLQEFPGEAARSLGQIGDPRAVEPLVKTLARINQQVAKDTPLAWSVQIDVVAGLSRLSDPRAVDVLVEAIRLGAGVVRKEAAVGLGRIGDPRGVEALVGIITSRSEATPEAAEALGRIADPRGIEALISVLEGSWADWVYDKALTSLRRITGQQLSKNPREWRDWLAKQRER